MTRFRLFSLVVLFLGLVWIGLSADRLGESTGGRVPAPRQGFPAPDFTLQTLDGQTIQLRALRGQAVVLNFWTTWCPPCRLEMPTLEKVAEEYRGQGVVILGVNSTIQDAVVDVENFVQEFGITFPILLDPQGSATRSYEIRALPTTFFIGADGVIHHVSVGGPISEATLRARIEEIKP